MQEERIAIPFLFRMRAGREILWKGCVSEMPDVVSLCGLILRYWCLSEKITNRFTRVNKMEFVWISP